MSAQQQKLGDTLRAVWSYTMVAVLEAVVQQPGQEGAKDKSITWCMTPSSCCRA